MKHLPVILSAVVLLAALCGLAAVTQAANEPPPIVEREYHAAYTTITATLVTVSGITPSYGACDAGGNQFLNDGVTWVEIKNANAAARAITVTTPVTYSGMGLADAYITVEATTGDKIIGPFPPKDFNENGYVKIDYNAVTNCTIAAFRLPE